MVYLLLLLFFQVKSDYWKPLAEGCLGDNVNFDFEKFESLFKEKEKEKKKKKKGSGSGGNNSRSGGQKKSKKQPSVSLPLFCFFLISLKVLKFKSFYKFLLSVFHEISVRRISVSV